jgi:hypothetical protein
MTYIEQTIALADLLGWTHIENTNTMAIGGIWRGYPPKDAIIGKKELLPRIDDLNVIARARKMFTPEEWCEYLSLRCFAASGSRSFYCLQSGESLVNFVDVTAAQEVEFVLRAAKKWNE